MALKEVPQFYTYNEDMGKETPSRVFRTIADHENHTDHMVNLENMLGEVLTSFLNNPRGGTLFYGVETEKMGDPDDCDCCAEKEKEKDEARMTCCCTRPKQGESADLQECCTNGKGKVKGISELHANRNHLQEVMENVFRNIQPRAYHTCCTLFLVPVMNVPGPYTTQYVAVFTVNPPPNPEYPFEYVPHNGPVEDHVKLTRSVVNTVFYLTPPHYSAKFYWAVLCVCGWI
jgi:hypothetical protein